MSARGLASLAIVLACGASQGCYLAHERSADAGARRDVNLPDAVFPDAVGRDAAPECRARCERPETIGTGSLPAFAAQGLFLESVLISPVVTPDAVFGVILASWPDSTSDAELRPTLFRISRATGALEWLPFPDALSTHPALHAAEVRLVGDALQLVVVQSSANSTNRDVSVGRGTWSTSTLALTGEADELLAAPFHLVPTLSGDAAAFGAQDLDLAVFADLGVVHAFTLRAGAPAALLDLVTLPDSGAVEPLSGALLADGRVVVVGGGVRALRTEARVPFMALGRLEDAPLPAQPIVGALHDAPPLVTAEGSGFALARHVTDDADVLRSAIRLVHHASDGSVLDEVRVPTTNGRRPLAMSLFASGGRAGLAWSEHAAASADGVELRVLTPGIDRGCESQAFDPVTALDADTVGLAAAAAEDGSVFVVTLTLQPGPATPTVRVIRVPACAR